MKEANFNGVQGYSDAWHYFYPALGFSEDIQCVAKGQYLKVTH